MAKYIYALTEVAVKGTTQNKTEYAAFKRKLTTKQKEKLTKILQEVCGNRRNSGYDTSDMVNEALEKFADIEFVRGRLVPAPIVDELIF